MRRKTAVVAIEFEVRDWERGFWITFRIPFTPENWANVFTIRGSASIKQIRKDV